jgi:hypothetical protein
VNNITIVLREVEWGGVGWIDMFQGPVEGSCEHGTEPPGSIKYWKILE